MRKLVKLAALLSLSLTTACASSTGTETGNAAQICRQWEPIRPSRKDVLTEGTATQIAGNNAANETWCGKQKIAEAKR